MPGRVVLALVLVVLWATVPWPQARWAALAGALFVAFSALWSLVLSRGLKARADNDVLRTFSGRRVEVRTRLENRSPLPSGLLTVFDSAGGLESWGETRSWTNAPPFTRQHFSFTVRGRERGQRSLGPITVAGADPAGLFPFSLSVAPRSLLVYPALHAVHGWPPGGHPSGTRIYEPALLDDPSRFRSYRDFQPGDPLARLSAAAWARRGSPQVRTYDRTVARPTGVVVDLRASWYPLRLRWALLEAAVETAASLVWESLGRGETVWLTVVDGTDLPATLGPGKGWPEARPFLERLALAVPDKSESPHTHPVLPRPPLRLLWVGPAQATVVAPGFELVRFDLEEGRGHGPVVHP